MLRSALVGCCIGLLYAATAAATVLVVAPHPDDDIITSAGIVYSARSRGEDVIVVYMTNGDNGGVANGYLRQGEAVSAQVNYLGATENDLIFLGYPDGKLWEIATNYPDIDDRYTTPFGQSVTYGNRGLGGSDYHTYRFGTAAPYNRHNILLDLQDIISAYKPDHIFTTAESDLHADHAKTYELLLSALQNVFAADPTYMPSVHKTIVWSTQHNIWPTPLDPTSYHEALPDITSTGLVWSQRESIDVPLIMQSMVLDNNLKVNAINAHQSQGGIQGILGQFVHKDEIFWVENPTSTNHAPVVNAGAGGIIVLMGESVQLDGSGSHDVDGDILSYQWTQSSGTLVQLLNANTATPNFIAPTGLVQDETLSFQLKVSDGQYTSIPDQVDMQVVMEPPGQNIAPLASNVTASSENTGTGQTAEKAIDGLPVGWPQDSRREWATIGGHAGAWIELSWDMAYIVDRVILFDRPNSSDRILSGTLTFSDGSAVIVPSLDNAGQAVSVRFSPRSVSSMRFTVDEVAPTTLNIGLAEIEVYGESDSGANLAPTAQAGDPQLVTEAALVQLDGSLSMDPNGDPLAYQWTQTAGLPVTLLGANLVNPSFIAPTGLNQNVTLSFQLIVNDGVLSSVPDTVNITVQTAISANSPPTADAGFDQNVSEGALVQLDGSTSIDPDGDPLTYRWTHILGSAVTLSDSTAVRPSFTAPSGLSQGETLRFELIVNDGQLDSTADTVDITVAAGNQSPQAQAGPDQTVLEGVLVQLDGSGSTDPNGEALTYQWTQISGIAVALNNAGIMNPSFTAPNGLSQAEVLVFELVVSDGAADTSSDTVTVTVSATPAQGNNIAPQAIALASSENARTGQLAAKAIDGIPAGYPVDYRREWATTGERNGAWIRLSWNVAYIIDRVVLFDRPNSSDHVTSATLTFNDGSSVPVGPLDNSGVGVEVHFPPRSASSLQLTIDQVGAFTSNIGLAEFEVYGELDLGMNLAPTAEAGSFQTVAEGALVQLNGTGSTDPNGDPLFYQWRQIGGTLVALSNANIANPSFVAPSGLSLDTVLQFELSVNDGLLVSAPDTVSITVRAHLNTAPIARAGADQTVDESVLVQLDGSASSDPDGDPLTYRWAQVAGPTIVLSDAAGANPSFTAPAGLTQNEIISFRLVVNDGRSDSTADIVQIMVVSAVQAQNIARLAMATASSQATSTGQTAAKAIDGVVSGYPFDYMREWASRGEGVGAWLELTWASAHIVDRVVLYDRPNGSDHITGATLSFSDGSTVATGSLDNSGGPVSVQFTPRSITGLRVTVDQVGPYGYNAGLSEIEVFEAP